MKLLDNASATGAAIKVLGGTYAWAVDGTFNGATITLQIKSPDGSSYLTLTDTALTAEGVLIVDLPSGDYKALVAGGPPSAMYATLTAVRNSGS